MDSTDQALIVIPDTNVLIEGKALRELPWNELNYDPIEVVICGPVIRELDTLKNNGGRAGRVARAWSTKVRELMTAPDKSEVLRENGPRVTARLLLGSSVSQPVRAGLDLTYGDQAIINQALAIGDGGADVVLLTDDNFAALTAEEHGLRTVMLPADWLKEPEADNSAKEIARRDAEIAQLKSAEPAPRLWFADEHGTPIERLETTMPRYMPVSASDVVRLIDRVSAAAPKSKDRPGAEQEQSSATRAVAGLQFTVADMIRSGTLGNDIPVTRADWEAYGEEYAS